MFYVLYSIFYILYLIFYVLSPAAPECGQQLSQVVGLGGVLGTSLFSGAVLGESEHNL